MKTKRYSTKVFVLALVSYIIMGICMSYRCADLGLCFGAYGLFLIVNGFNVKDAETKRYNEHSNRRRR